MNSREIFFMNKTGLAPLQSSDPAYFSVRDNSKEGASEEKVETKVTGSFHSGVFKNCSKSA